MIGHSLFSELRKSFDVKVSLRLGWSKYEALKFYNREDCFLNIDALDFKTIEDMIKSFRPHVVINAIGAIKQKINIINIENSIYLNSLFPHKLSRLITKYKFRLILLSTDCVFSGDDGGYNENHKTDAVDLYGRTKILGEVSSENILVIRKSTIGLEISGQHGLVEWFIKQDGQINGYNRAIYSGLISSEFARFIKNIILDHKKLNGIYHLSSEPISKYNLLKGLKERLNLKNVFINEDNIFVCNRSLNMKKLKKVTGYTAPSWDKMLDELAEEIIIKKHFS